MSLFFLLCWLQGISLSSASQRVSVCCISFIHNHCYYTRARLCDHKEGWVFYQLMIKFQSCSRLVSLVCDLHKLFFILFLLSAITFYFPLLQERGPIPGPKNGLLSNTWKWIIQGDTCVDKAREFIGKWSSGREQECKGTQEDCSAVSGFMVMELVPGLSLASPCDWPSWWHYSAGMDSRVEDSWTLVGHVVSPFDLSQFLPVDGGLLVPCSLPGSPVIK